MINTDKLFLLLIGAAIVLVSLSTKMPTHFDLSDEGFIPAMTMISMAIPQNEKLISSEIFGNLVYFSKNNITIPHGATSEKSLLYSMVKNNTIYLLVIENNSRVHALKQLFSSDGLNNLTTDFQKIGDFPTDQYKFHLYKINKNWTFYH